MAVSNDDLRYENTTQVVKYWSNQLLHIPIFDSLTKKEISQIEMIVEGYYLVQQIKNQ